MFRKDLWVKEGDFSKAIPLEIHANCQYFVKYRKGANQLCLAKRIDCCTGKDEYQITYTSLDHGLFSKAMNLEVYDSIALKMVKAAINPYHVVKGKQAPDGIQTVFCTKLEHHQAALDFIDSVNPLNEIKEDVYANLTLSAKSCESRNDQSSPGRCT